MRGSNRNSNCCPKSQRRNSKFCFCINSNKTDRKKKKRRSEKKRLSSNVDSEYSKLEKIEGQETQLQRIEDFEFENRGFRANLPNFWSFMKSGSNTHTSIVAQMSSVSVFAFIDKQGVCTETQKYVDELAVLDTEEKGIIVDLEHDAGLTDKENKVYSPEGKLADFEEKKKKLRVLSLAIMLARNPRETDGPNRLHEVFMTSDHEDEATEINSNPGFHFHNSAWKENEYHQDCACALSMMLGQSDAKYCGYEHILSLWSMVDNPLLEMEHKKKERHKQPKRGFNGECEHEVREHYSFEARIEPEQRLIVDENLSESENSEADKHDLKDAHFVEQKQERKLLLERNNRYQHIICNIVLDKNSQQKAIANNLDWKNVEPQLQSFCRSEALTILENCTDYWNGEQVVPFTEKAKTTIKELMQQWNSENFDPIGYSYKPVTPDVTAELTNLKKGQPLDKELVRRQTEKQIFLGMVGFKHHKRRDAKKVC